MDHPANQHALQHLRKRHAQRQGRIAQLLAKFAPAPEAGDDSEELDTLADTLAVSVADILQKAETPEELDALLSETMEQFKDHIIKASAADCDDDEMEDGEVGSGTPPGKGKKKPLSKDGDGPGEDDGEDEDEDEEDMDKRLHKQESHHETTEHNVNNGDRQALLKSFPAQARQLITKQDETIATLTQNVTTLTKSITDLVQASEARDLQSRALALIGKGNMPVDEAVSLLKGAQLLKNAGDEKAVERVEAVIKRQSELVEKSELFEELGSDNSDGTSGEPYAQLQKRATEIQSEIRKSGKAITAQQAFTKACEEDPDLYEEYVNAEA